MFRFDPVTEIAFSRCVPFEESPVYQSDDCKQLLNAFHAAHRRLERRFPEEMEEIDDCLDVYLELSLLKCRYYFSQGCRLAAGKAD